MKSRQARQICRWVFRHRGPDECFGPGALPTKTPWTPQQVSRALAWWWRHNQPRYNIADSIAKRELLAPGGNLYDLVQRKIECLAADFTEQQRAFMDSRGTSRWTMVPLRFQDLLPLQQLMDRIYQHMYARAAQGSPFPRDPAAHLSLLTETENPNARPDDPSV